MIIGSGIPKDSISISIKETKNGGKRVATLNSNKYRTPASIVKAATTYAALLRLGDSYRWATKIYRDGDINGGVLDGNIIIKGYGDPTLNSKSVTKIVEYIKAKGISKIDGNIVIDKSYFDTPNACSAMFDENSCSPYNALPNAISFNDNTSTIKIVNGNQVVQSIKDDSYDIINDIVTTDEPCRGSRSWPSVNIRYGERSKVQLGGTISSQCPTISIKNVITQPHFSFYGSLKEQLNSNGVEFDGDLKVRKAPSGAKEIATIYSEPIFSIIGHTNKKSDNLYARQIFLTLGAKEYDGASTLEKSRKAVVSILERNGIRHASSFKLDNGSGLSRSAKVTTEAFEEMLDSAYATHGDKWLNALSIAGVDGTIKSRFPSSLKRRVWMKTGTVNRVKNIVGYVKATDGTMYTVAIIVNDKLAASRGAALENTIISWLANSNVKDYATVDTKREIYKENSQNETKKVKQLDINSTKVAPKIFIKPADNNVTTISQYYIQVGMFDNRSKQKIINKISGMGYGYKSIPTGASNVYNGVSKLLVGPFKSKQDALDKLEQIRYEIAQDAFLLHI